MFREKKVTKEEQICPESASLWTKLHNVPYLLSHKRLLVPFYMMQFVETALFTVAFITVLNMLSTELKIIGGMMIH